MRDPRIEPRPGDEISRDIKRALQGVILREVERSHGGFVAYFADNGYQKRWKIIPLEDWRRWSSTAVVIKRGDDGIAGGN